MYTTSFAGQDNNKIVTLNLIITTTRGYSSSAIKLKNMNRLNPIITHECSSKNKQDKQIRLPTIKRETENGRLPLLSF